MVKKDTQAWLEGEDTKPATLKELSQLPEKQQRIMIQRYPGLLKELSEKQKEEAPELKREPSQEEKIPPAPPIPDAPPIDEKPPAPLKSKEEEKQPSHQKQKQEINIKISDLETELRRQREKLDRVKDQETLVEYKNNKEELDRISTADTLKAYEKLRKTTVEISKINSRLMGETDQKEIESLNAEKQRLEEEAAQIRSANPKLKEFKTLQRKVKKQEETLRRKGLIRQPREPKPKHEMKVRVRTRKDAKGTTLAEQIKEMRGRQQISAQEIDAKMQRQRKEKARERKQKESYSLQSVMQRRRSQIDLPPQRAPSRQKSKRK
ncbi:hypothetical protein ACFLY6_02510 [Candidatus Dependentiae bacterium]